MIGFNSLYEDIHLGFGGASMAGVERIEDRKSGLKCKLHGVVENSKNPCSMCSTAKELKRFSLKVKVGRKEAILDEMTGLLEMRFVDYESESQTGGKWRSIGKGGRTCCDSCSKIWKSANSGVVIKKKFLVTYGTNVTVDGLVASMAQEVHESNCQECRN